MPANPIHPDQLGGEQSFRADLVAYLDSLPAYELAEVLGELPSSRREPLRLGVLMVALNEGLPDAYKLLPSAGRPGPHEGRRLTVREELVADRRAARAARRAGPPRPGLVEWQAGRQRQAEQHADRRRAGAVAERRVAETLRTWATDLPAVGHQERGEPSTGSPAWQHEGRDHDRQDR